MEEVWKDIEGYEGYYQISNFGNVKSLDRIVNNKFLKGMNLKTHRNRDGYCVITLSKNRKTKNKKLHRVVAIAFISNPNNLREINHKDEDKTNNSISNLEWCSRKYNLNYRSESHKGYRGREIFQYDKNGTLINKWISLVDAQRTGLYTESGIRHCIKRKQKYYKGYIWSYNNKIEVV